MQLELYCPSCLRRFAPGPRSAVATALKGLEEAGPWSALGDGETVQDLLYNALASAEETDCPDCGVAAKVHEGTLGDLTHSLLATW
jgi:hypothetical protein